MNRMNQEGTVIVKKSELTASCEFDYHRLEYPQEQFVPCTIQESGEELIIQYDRKGLTPFCNIRRERKDYKYAVLLDVMRLIRIRSDYKFSLHPDNLCYDRCYRAYALERDIYQKGEQCSEKESIQEYKALIAYALQDKYDFSDYYEGGMELMRKNKFLSAVCGFETFDEIADYLQNAFERENTRIRDTKILVNRDNMFMKRGYAVTATVLLLALTGILAYGMLAVRPLEQAVMKSDQAYIDGDYIKIIDSLAAVPADKLDAHHKYTLALSYVRGENLTNEQRNNIISGLSVNSDEKILRYWIAIGRLDAAEAENIAMQNSDDELLLYAYMKERSLVESDTEMDGQQKAARLAELESSIEELSKKYQPEEES